MKSALEKEVFSTLIRFRYWLHAHDRGVILGLLLAIPPIPPVPLLGFGLSLFNYTLWKRHRLGNHEIPLIRLAMVTSLVSTILAATLIYAMVSIIASPETNALLSDITAQIIEKIQFLRHFFSSNNRVEVML